MGFFRPRKPWSAQGGRHAKDSDLRLQEAEARADFLLARAEWLCGLSRLKRPDTKPDPTERTA